MRTHERDWAGQGADCLASKARALLELLLSFILASSGTFSRELTQPQSIFYLKFTDHCISKSINHLKNDSLMVELKIPFSF
jgi:hypothetical protein